MSQVDARCHRNGKSARVYWTYAKGTVEEDVIKRVVARKSSWAMTGSWPRKSSPKCSPRSSRRNSPYPAFALFPPRLAGAAGFFCCPGPGRR